MDLPAASLRDLADDFDELAFIARSGRERAVAALAELKQARSHISWPVLRMMEAEVRSLREAYEAQIDELRGLRRAALTGTPSSLVLYGLTESKAVHAELLRARQTLLAAAITATDWQSPSFGHSVRSTAGRWTGRVTEHVDDYKRDRHPDAAEFELAFLREYVDAPPGVDVRALMTSCGMSAFTTIVAYLQMEEKVSGPVMVGRRLYHECRQLIWGSDLRCRAVDIDELDLPGTLRAIEEHRPGAVFLDSLCNSKGIAVPDLAAVIKRLARRDDRVYLVIDNTGLSCTFQPLALLPPGPTGLRLLVFESLTKYAQLGLDRTAAGVILALPDDAEGLSDYREHLGTNVADSSAHVVPRPCRSVLERRLQRLDRNASLLATHLQEHAERLGSEVFEGVCYPGLPHHPSFAVARGLAFRGSFFSIGFGPGHDRPDVHRRFIRAVLEEASRVEVAVVAGASFGLNTTRVYPTASRTDRGSPFVRVSAGTEHRVQVEDLKVVMVRAMHRLAEGARDRHRVAVGRGA